MVSRDLSWRCVSRSLDRWWSVVGNRSSYRLIGVGPTLFLHKNGYGFTATGVLGELICGLSLCSCANDSSTGFEASLIGEQFEFLIVNLQ